VAIEDSVADILDLPFMHDVIDHPSSATTKVEYDNRSAFSLPVNHRDCYTGVTDDDRALTINRLADIAKYPSGLRFASEFQIPGHVHLLRGAPGLLSDRQGHTELGLVLAQHANVATAVVICEMLDDESGKSVTKEDAKAYANARDILFLDGHEIVTLLSSSDAADSSEAVGHSH
jgi:3,4-dihydroxy 2-butanone 4-phosphate synthase